MNRNSFHSFMTKLRLFRNSVQKLVVFLLASYNAEHPGEQTNKQTI